MHTPAERSAFERQLGSMYAPIADDLCRAEQVLRDELRSKVDFVEELTARVQLYRGKRLRPALLLLVAQATGEVRPAHHKLAAVVEMIHAATLVHDDILDGADRRRHVTTVNAEWGSEASVLLGDFLFTHSFHLAASLESTLACRAIGRATNIVCEGELHQIARRGAFELSEDEYLTIISGKTAELIACCGWLGAHFAGADQGVSEAMEQFGRELGIAFQIADDLFDLLADERDTGKSLGTDLRNRKPTLPLIRFRQTADEASVRACKLLFDDPGADQRGAVLAYLERSDALAYTKSQARRFAESAAHRLDGLAQSPAREILLGMTRFVIDRIA